MAKSFNRETVVQGRLNQAAANETPNSFATINGGAKVNETSVLATPDTRMAGQEGARAMQLMTDPVEAQRTANWMSAFGLSNQGMQWNEAKMIMNTPPSVQGQE